MFQKRSHIYIVVKSNELDWYKYEEEAKEDNDFENSIISNIQSETTQFTYFDGNYLHGDTWTVKTRDDVIDYLTEHHNYKKTSSLPKEVTNQI